MGLPLMVQKNLDQMDEETQAQFYEEYNRNKKSKFTIFCFWIIAGWHYAYVGRWWTQLFFWATAGGLLIWWFLDLFRIWGLVDERNKPIAIEALKNVKALSMPAPPPIPTRRAS